MTKEKINKLDEIEILKEAASETYSMTSSTTGTTHFTKYYSQLTARFQQDDSLKKDRYFNKRPASLKMRSLTRKRSEEMILNIFKWDDGE